MVENFTNCHHSCCILFSTLLAKLCLIFDAPSICYAFIIKQMQATPQQHSDCTHARTHTHTHTHTYTSCCCLTHPQSRRAARETFPWQVSRSAALWGKSCWLWAVFKFLGVNAFGITLCGESEKRERERENDAIRFPRIFSVLDL